MKMIAWAILFSAILYFGLGSLYWYGYSRGQATVKINRAVCMPEIVKWGKCDFTKTSNYPKKPTLTSHQTVSKR